MPAATMALIPKQKFDGHHVRVSVSTAAAASRMSLASAWPLIQLNGVDQRRIVPGDDLLEFHPSPVNLRDRPKSRPDACGVVLKKPIFDNDLASFHHVTTCQVKDLVDRPVSLDLDCIGHVGFR